MADEELGEARLAILRDVAAGKVCDDADFCPRLNLGEDGEADVSTVVWLLERQRLVVQPFAERRWRLTDAGRSHLDVEASGDG